MADDLIGLGKAIEAITKELGELINPLVRPGAEVAGQMFADRWNHWRLTQMVSLVKKQKKLLEDNNIEPKAVPPKLLIPILGSGSLEDDDYLLNKWAGLLASAAAGDRVLTSFPKILAELTPADAKILDPMYQRFIDTAPEQRTSHLIREQNLFTIQMLIEKIMLSYFEFELALFNIQRLELVIFPALQEGNPLIHIDYSREIRQNEKIKLSPFGREFVRACRGPLPRE